VVQYSMSNFRPTPMKLYTFIVCFMLYSVACWIFSGLTPFQQKTPIAGVDFQLGYFQSTFYTFNLISCALLCFSFLVKQNVVSFIVTIIISLLGILSGYLVPSVFSIKACIFIAIAIGAGMTAKIPINIINVSSSVVILAIFQNYRGVIENSLITFDKHGLQQSESTLLIVLTLGTGAATVAIRQLTEKMHIEQRIKEHGQQVMVQLSVLNQRLQARAREIGEESAVKERNRIIREMHDANGYAFTNIIALMNAVISSGGQDWSMIEDLLQTTRNQAHDGLKESRMTLRALRETLTVQPRNLYTTIHEISSIFHDCTGVEVNVFYGNIRKDYGSRINKIVSRIVQEALTNAVRHGRATEVTIQLWEVKEILNLYVADNGVGSVQVVKGLGLAGMEERVNPFGGSVQFSAPVSGGFKLMITIPLNTHTGDQDG